jgi:hypothetical protein
MKFALSKADGHPLFFGRPSEAWAGSNGSGFVVQPGLDALTAVQ